MCQNTLPYCIASGKHMVKENCVFCKQCNFPANYEALTSAVSIEPNCPMCNLAIDTENIVIV
jgi:WD repeat-containing protein 19